MHACPKRVHRIGGTRIWNALRRLLAKQGAAKLSLRTEDPHVSGSRLSRTLAQLASMKGIQDEQDAFNESKGVVLRAFRLGGYSCQKACIEC